MMDREQVHVMVRAVLWVLVYAGMVASAFDLARWPGVWLAMSVYWLASEMVGERRRR